MAKIKNTARGPRGLRNENGDVVMIEAGDTVEGNFPASEVKDFKAMLAAEAGPSPEADDDGDDGETAEKPLSRMNKAELLAVAADEGIATVKGADNADVAVADASNKQIADAIQAKRDANA